MDKRKANAISSRFKDLMEDFAKEYGLVFDRQSVRGIYDFNTYTMNGVKFIESNGKSADEVQQELFMNDAYMYGIKKDKYYATFMLQGQEFYLVGFNPKGRKNVLRIKQVDTGKNYVCSTRSLPKEFFINPRY